MLSGQMEFGQSPDDAAYEARQRRVPRAVGLVLVVVGLIGFIWACRVLYQDGMYGWQTTNWDRLEAGGLLPVPFVLLMFSPLLVSRGRTTALRRVLEPLRLLSLASEVRFAPPAALQPAPLTAEERGGTAVFSSLRSVGNARSGAGSLWMSMTVVGYTLGMVAITAPPALGQGFSSSIFGVPIFLVTLPAYVLGLGGIVLTYASVTRGRKGLTVTADATGLRWRQPGAGRQEQSVPWGSISSFVKLSTSVPYGVPHTVYGATAGGAVLTWTLISASRRREYAESDLLSSWIVTRTGQPLRLYINDDFIEAYTDTYHLNHDLPVTGRVGMFVGDGSITGSFSDFAVYPVQSPPSLSYV
jgi:hypothetical protein